MTHRDHPAPPADLAQLAARAKIVDTPAPQQTLELRREIVANFMLLWLTDINATAPDLGISAPGPDGPASPAALGFVHHDGLRRYYALEPGQVEWLRSMLNAQARDAIREALAEALEEQDESRLLLDGLVAALCGPEPEAEQAAGVNGSPGAAGE